jgi:hypothetical protein
MSALKMNTMHSYTIHPYTISISIDGTVVTLRNYFRALEATSSLEQEAVAVAVVAVEAGMTAFQVAVAVAGGGGKAVGC